MGKDDPILNGIERKLKPTASVLAEYKSIRGGHENRADGPARVPPLGNVTNMVIMIRFSDHQARPLPSNSDIETLVQRSGW